MPGSRDSWRISRWTIASSGGGPGKLLSPARRREAVRHAQATLSVSERRACRVVGQCRATQQYEYGAPQTDDEDRLWTQVIALAHE